jgi:SSS family solute:Na+ symporter
MLLAAAQIRSVDLFIIFAYMLGMVAMGLWLTRKSRTVEAYTVAARSLPGWLVGISIVGTYVSSISFLALPGKAYGGNWNAFVLSLSLPIAALAAVHWFLPLYRRTGLISAYQYLEERLGGWARVYACISFVLLQLGRVGAILYLVGLVLTRMTGLDIISIIVITGLITIVYTALGGIEAVIWTDVVQVFIFFGGTIAALLILLIDAPSGLGHLFTSAWQNSKFSLGTWDLSVTAPTVWVVLVYGILENLKNFGIDQNYVQRYNTTRTDHEARRSVWLGALAYIPLSALFFLIGTCLWVYYQGNPGQLPAELAEKGNADKVFPHFILTKMPVGVTGLVLAALLAAAMSTVSSSLNAAATVCLEDIYKKYIRAGAGDRHYLWALRSMTVWWGILGTGAGMLFLALMKIYTNALDLWWTIAGICGAGMIGPFLLGAFLKRVSNTGAVIGVVASVVVVMWATFARNLSDAYKWMECPLHTFLIGVAGVIALMIVGWTASQIWPPPANRPPPKTVWNVKRQD